MNCNKEDEVDDIFKSFVNNKLQQLGMIGISSSELEKSLQKSAFNKMALKSQPVNLSTPPADTCNLGKKEKKNKKHKKEKKKKHKKEKRQETHSNISQIVTSTDVTNVSCMNNCNDSNKCNKNMILKKQLLEDEETEVVIKKKKLNCYHDTVSKLKEIEKLSLSIDEEKLSTTTTNHAESTVLSSSLSVEQPNDNQTVKLKSLGEKESHSEKTEIIKAVEQNENNDKTASVKSVSSTSSIAGKSTLEQTIESTASTKNPNNEPAPGEIVGESENKPTSTQPSKETPKKEISERRSRSRSRKHSRRSSSHEHSSSRSRKRKRSSSRHKSRSPRRHRHHHSSSRSRRRNSDSHRKHKSSRRRRSPSPLITDVDKVKLLEIAKANVLAQHKADITISSLSHESKAVLRSGGVTLKQLTGVCQDIVAGKREVIAASNDGNSSKVHHPFQVRENPVISINLKNSIPAVTSAPAKPINELTKEFPVSCGSQHQRKEVLEEVYGKWEPIVKDEEAKTSIEAFINDKVFPDAAVDNSLAIKDVIAQRVSAVRELQNNPNDINAMKNMFESQQKLDSWTCSKQLPGQFTGHTGLQPLKRSELERGHQAWASNNSLNSEKQVGGIGKSLLQKMGWKEGESLGKSNIGMLEPLKVNVKTDRKGLSSMMECSPSQPQIPKKSGGQVVLKDLSGKHPVSALMEICSKRKWKAPDFLLVRNDGPDHHRTFMFKVCVNGVFYQPSIPSMNKKLAKSQAASAALQAMGLIPS